MQQMYLKGSVIFHQRIGVIQWIKHNDNSNWELRSRDVPAPDNKSLGCCCRNSLPTVINPLSDTPLPCKPYAYEIIDVTNHTRYKSYAYDIIGRSATHPCPVLLSPRVASRRGRSSVAKRVFYNMVCSALLYGPCMIVPHKWTKICWLATAN